MERTGPSAFAAGVRNVWLFLVFSILSYIFFFLFPVSGRRPDTQGVSKNVDLFGECYNSVIPRGNFSKVPLVVANRYPFAPMMFYYQVALLTGSDVVIL